MKIKQFWADQWDRSIAGEVWGQLTTFGKITIWFPYMTFTYMMMAVFMPVIILLVIPTTMLDGLVGFSGFLSKLFGWIGNLFWKKKQ